MADFLDKMIVGISKGKTNISENSKNMVEKAKINTAIHEAEESKKKLTEFIGFKAYNLYINGIELPEELTNLCSEIKKRDEEILTLKNNLSFLTYKTPETYSINENYKACTICSQLNNHQAIFCKQCGSKLI